jgi:hypothetical protein
MTGDAPPRDSFVKEYVLGILPHALIRSMAHCLGEPRSFVREVEARRWSKVSHPAAYALATLGVLSAFMALTPFTSPEVTWPAVMWEVGTPDAVRFAALFELTQADVEAAVVDELFDPGTTVASAKIRGRAGTIDVDELSVFLAAHDPQLALRWTRAVKRMRVISRWSDAATPFLAVLALAIAASVAHLLLKSRGQSFRTGFYILLYLNCSWALLGAGVTGAVTTNVPNDGSLLSRGLGAGEFALAIVAISQIVFVYGLVYARTRLRRSLTVLLALGVYFVLLVSMSSAVDHAIRFFI